MKQFDKILDFPAPDLQASMEEGILDPQNFFAKHTKKRAWYLVEVEQTYTKEDYFKIC